MAYTPYGSYEFGFAAGSANREDLLDIVVNIAPWETPFFSTAPKTTVNHTTHEWIEDTLAAANENVAFVEGDDFSGQAVQARSRITNITQIFRKDVRVTNTQRAVNPAGVRDEYGYQIEIALKEIARNIESRIFGTAVSASASSASRLMKNLASYITSNTASSTANSGASKTSIDTLVRLCFQAGGNPGRLYVHPFHKNQLANATGDALGGASSVNYRNIAATDQRVVANIDVYHSVFGMIELVPDRFIPTATATATAAPFGASMWLIEQPKVRIGFLRPIKHVPLPPAGDATRGMVLGELTMEVQAQAAHGRALNCIMA